MVSTVLEIKKKINIVSKGGGGGGGEGGVTFPRPSKMEFYCEVSKLFCRSL